MNSSEVAKLLGVSTSTIQRWVKQLNLPMERNDRGHYLFKDEDIELLKQIHQKIQQGIPLQEITPFWDKKSRKGTVITMEGNKSLENFSEKLEELESRLNAKADSVATYQLLQHRREIDEMQDQIKTLLNKITTLENQMNTPTMAEKPPVLDQITSSKKKSRKKNIVSSFFGF